MMCPECSKDVPGDRKFCSNCGSPVDHEKQTRQGETPGGGAHTPAPAAPAPGKSGGGPARKRLTSNEIEGFSPPVLKPVKKSGPHPAAEPRRKPDPRKAAASLWAALAKPWKLIPPIDSKLPPPAKSALSMGAAALVVIIIIITAGRAGDKVSKPQPIGGLPSDVRLLDEKISDNAEATKIELYVEAGNSVQEAHLRQLLETIMDSQKKRSGFKFNEHPTDISIFAYSSESIYRQDRLWWIGSYSWVEGVDSKVELNMDALLPRNEAGGYTGVTREEYLKKVDDIFEEIHFSMNFLNESLDAFERMLINQEKFLERGEEQADIIYENVRELPGPPWNDCADLAAAFEDMVEATSYFEALFTPDSGLFTTERFDSAEFNSRMSEYYRREAVYLHERQKFKKSRVIIQ